jgi:hypothetical protein
MLVFTTTRKMVLRAESPAEQLHPELLHWMQLLSSAIEAWSS